VIALIHDVLVVMCAAGYLASTSLSLTTLAAVLTVIAYSVHDTTSCRTGSRDSDQRRREPIASS